MMSLHFRLSLVVASIAGLGGCATVAPATAPLAPTVAAPVAAAAASAPSARTAAAAASAPASAASGAATAAARPDPSAPRPFEEVVKGATRIAGFVPLWRKDEKVWLEIPPERLDQRFLLSVNIASSVGERGLYASQMGPSWLASFRKVGSAQIQLVAHNTAYVAADAPTRATIEQSYSNSLVGSGAIASAPHPERKSILVDAAFLLSDLPAYSTALERAYRLPYSLDRSNSSWEKLRADDALTMLSARMHFATARLPAPPLVPSPVPLPMPPQTLPDPRSLFVGFVYNFAQLPEAPMKPRLADGRIGHFDDIVNDIGDESRLNAKRHFVNRWRLEKADPAAAMSEPKKPIVFWLDRNIPVKYRASVEAGVLEWNKAFEAIGFRGAIQARQQPDDADWDSMDASHASIRWFTGADVGFAIGPSHSDPRTGEILDADIGLSDVFARGSRRFLVEDLGGGGVAAAPFAAPLIAPGSPLAAMWRRAGQAQCSYAHEAAAETGFALDLLEARGDLAPDDPQTEALVQQVIKDTVMHEVGHTLGLKHNFKASSVYTRAQLQDREFTAKNGITASVMDYSGYNLAMRGEPQGSLRNTTIGPYDYWAIAYAYSTFADEAAEKKGLAAIVARSGEPWLAFGDDADAREGVDPYANVFDLGDDPLAYYAKRLALSRELWERAEALPPGDGEDGLRQRRMLASGFRSLGNAADLLAKYVGGMVASRDPAPGRQAWTPVAPARQREALRFLADGLFNPDSFRFKPEFLAGIAPDYREWDRGGPVNVGAAVLAVQTAALDRIMSPSTAGRVLNLASFLPAEQRKAALSLPEVYGTLQGAVWSELKAGRDIDPMRRNLQREHLRRVQALLTRGAPALPADALALVRLNATELQAELRRVAARPGLAIETRAHLQDSLSTVTEALRASMLRG